MDEKKEEVKKYRLKKCLSIPIENLTKDELSNHKKNLTIQSKLTNYVSQKPMPPMVIFKIKNGKIKIPRYYAIQNFKDNIIDERTYIINDNFPKYVGHELEETKRKQVSAFDAALKCFEEHGGATLCLGAGTGKTITALKISSHLKTPTLIVVPGDTLYKQWINEINQNFDHPKIGFIRQKKCDYKDKDFVISTIQSIILPKWSKEVYDYFGLVIMDEAHHVSAKEFSKTLNLFSSKYNLALTATPERDDGFEKVLEQHIGPITFKPKRHYDIRPIVEVVHLDCPSVEESFNKNGTKNYAKMLNDLTTMKERNDMMMEYIETKMDLNRHMMALTDRREHSLELSKNFQDKFPDKRIKSYLGGASEKEFKELFKTDFIIATYQKGGEGLNIPSLSMMFFLTPSRGTKFEQALPRIMRGNETQAPIVVDFLDDDWMWKKHFYERKKYYDKEGFEIKHIYLGEKEIKRKQKEEKKKRKKEEESIDNYFPKKLKIQDECPF